MFSQEVEILRFQEQEEAHLATLLKTNKSFNQGGFLIKTPASSFSKGSLQLIISS